MINKIVVNPENEGDRLDIFLRNYYKTVPRMALQHHIGEGRVMVNGLAAKSSLRLKGGDCIEVEQLREKKVILRPEPVPFGVLYYDEYIIAVDKPSGIVVHPGSGNVSHTLVNGLLYRFGRLSAEPDRIRPGIVHRLDKDTSGVMIVTRTDESYEKMKAQFKNREITKQYLAIVHGIPRFSSNIIDAPLRPNTASGNGMKMEISKEGKEAVTKYEVVQEAGKYSLIKVWPKTGRTHQIRVHLSSLGNPVLCDPKYGKEPEIPLSALSEKEDPEHLTALNRLALHAASITFCHPVSEEEMTFNSPIPPEFDGFMRIASENMV